MMCNTWCDWFIIILYSVYICIFSTNVKKMKQSHVYTRFKKVELNIILSPGMRDKLLGVVVGRPINNFRCYWWCLLFLVAIEISRFSPQVSMHMSYLRYLCLFAHGDVLHILCCVFVLFVFILCALCCQFLWIVHFWLPLRYSLTLKLVIVMTTTSRSLCFWLYYGPHNCLYFYIILCCMSTLK
jgi:hypothetical protein